MVEYQTEIVALSLIAWMMILLIMLVCYRTSVVFFTEKPTNSFSPLGDDLSTFGQRLTRSYTNVTEFVPFILSILLFSIATNQTHITDDLAIYILAARISHSSVHVLSINPLAIGIRSLLLWVQIAILGNWVLRLGHHFL